MVTAAPSAPLEIAENYQNESDALLRGIKNHAVWVALSVRRPRMNYQIKDAVVSIADGDQSVAVASDLCQQPRWRLLPDSINEKFDKLEQRARHAIASRSVNFPALRGVSLLPISKAKEAFSEINRIDSEFKEERDQFILRYSELIAEIEQRLPATVFKRLRSRLPGANSLQTSFGVYYMALPLGGASVDQRQLQLALERLDRINEQASSAGAVDEIFEHLESVGTFLRSLQNSQDAWAGAIDGYEAHEYLQQADRELRTNIRQFVDRVASEPRAVIATAVENLITSLKEGKVIKAGTLGQVERAFELASGFTFLGQDLPGLIERGRALLRGYAPKDLNSNETLSQRLASQLEPIMQQASSLRAAKESVERFRNVCFRVDAEASE
jgi:hypothetical protein